METPDRALEWRDLLERYRQMSDEELLELAGRSADLTDVAQQALAYAMSQRKLQAPTQAALENALEQPPYYEDDPDSPYAEDRQLVEICTVWSLRDALQVQNILDRAGIPFFMGPEKATGVDKVTSDFSRGVSVQIMRIGLPWAGGPMSNYEPKDEPESEAPEPEEVPVRCPRCRSTEVVFERRLAAADGGGEKFKWRCDGCGNRWEDDGIVKSGTL
jgi:DNA-directed RNA polymerase subunit M/transcription elongation factor TFIIS